MTTVICTVIIKNKFIYALPPDKEAPMKIITAIGLVSTRIKAVPVNGKEKTYLTEIFGIDVSAIKHGYIALDKNDREK